MRKGLGGPLEAKASPRSL